LNALGKRKIAEIAEISEIFSTALMAQSAPQKLKDSLGFL
jgi:hypothetical protein